MMSRFQDKAFHFVYFLADDDRYCFGPTLINLQWHWLFLMHTDTINILRTYKHTHGHVHTCTALSASTLRQLLMCGCRLLEKFEACEKDPSYLAFLQANSTLTRSTPPLLPSSTPPLPLYTHPAGTWRNLMPSPASRPMTTPTQQVEGSKGGYDRIIRSLLSGFPNEVDFSFNTLTIMLFKYPSTFPKPQVRCLITGATPPGPGVATRQVVLYSQATSP